MSQTQTVDEAAREWASNAISKRITLTDTMSAWLEAARAKEAQEATPDER